jgi:hypothetical protein
MSITPDMASKWPWHVNRKVERMTVILPFLLADRLGRQDISSDDDDSVEAMLERASFPALP